MRSRVVIERIITINLSAYGFTGLHFGITLMPDDLAALVDQEYVITSMTKQLQMQYLPARVYEAYMRINNAMDSDIGMGSVYWSLAYQAIVFLRYLAENEFDVVKAAARIAVTGYSEHGNPALRGMYVCMMEMIFDEEGVPLSFGDSVEYRWLAEHAKEYSFHLSYREGNLHGIIREPWYWCYEQ